MLERCSGKFASLRVINTKRPPCGGFSICESLFTGGTLIRQCYGDYKLDELGIKEVDGEIVFIDNMEVSHE
jgi:hypothetical protein